VPDHAFGEAGALILLALRLGIGIEFILVGARKVFKVQDFRAAIRNYSIIPDRMLTAAAVSISGVEVVAGTMLVIGIALSVAAGLIAALALAFAFAIAVNLRRGRSFDCGCGGDVSGVISWKHVLVNSIFVAAAVAIAVAPPDTIRVLRWPTGLIGVTVPSGSVLPVALATVLVMLVLRVARAAGDLRASVRGG
jgi:uncharacterized membrane protein YphA (DoxX/SURF4 family)